MLRMTVARYPQYRDHERQRIQTNDTMMGLLAGSKLASQTLRLTEGSGLVLSQIFSRVEHIERFNLRTDKAREILDDAENLLGILAVPQVIGLQEDLLKGMLLLLATTPAEIKQSEDVKAAFVHDRFESVAGPTFTAESVELFHLVRVARNTHIHAGGRADTKLINRYKKTSPEALAVWEHITGGSLPEYSKHDNVKLGLLELIGILALSKRLSEEANVALQSALPATAWCDLVVEDWLATKRTGNEKQVLRQLLGFARHGYAVLGLSDDDLLQAMDRARQYAKQ